MEKVILDGKELNESEAVEWNKLLSEFEKLVDDHCANQTREGENARNRGVQDE